MTSSEGTPSIDGPSGSLPEACSHAELIDAWVDRALSDAERELAEQHLSVCTACRQDARDLACLHEILAEERVAPEPRAVDLGVRQPGWQRWAAAAAVLVAAFGTAVGLVTLAPAGESAVAAVASLFDFAATIGLLGSGLLDASWRGLGAAIASGFEQAAPALLFGCVAAVSLTALLFSLLRGGSRAAARERSRR